MDKPQEASKPEENYTPLLVAVFLVILSLIIFAIYTRKKSKRTSILLTGLCDSGKTLLYSRLVHRKFMLTQTSIKENIGSYAVNGNALRIIDIPGHERLRDMFFEMYKSMSRGIVYVVDSQTIQKDIRDAAEFLYNILNDPVIAGNCPSVLILCNKQDEKSVQSCEEIKEILEKEINTLRITKASQLESVDPKTKKNTILGSDDDEAFSFDSVSQYNVEFAETFATNIDKECNIDDLEEWLMRM